jgi:probable HAF family extracellular repeat protein
MALLAVAALGAGVSAQAGLALVDLGHLDGSPVNSGDVAHISADGQVVVGSSGGRAFRWHGGTMVEFAGGSVANAVNADGSVIVGEFAGTHHAFRWTIADGMQDLGELPGVPGTTVANGVSADGSVVVGEVQTDTAWHAWIWNAIDGMQDIGSLGTGSSSSANGVSGDGSIVVGYSQPHAFRWSAADGMVTVDSGLPETAVAAAYAISADASTIVGSYNTNPQAVHNLPDQFRVSAGGMSGLWSPLWGDATPGSALGVNDDGSRIVGYIFYYLSYASLWTPELGVLDLNAWLPANGLAIDGWSLLSANGISANGDAIVGTAYYYDDTMSEAEPRLFLITGINASMPIFVDGFESRQR